MADDADATLGRLADNESLARVGIAVELLIVLTQALTALWFYRLFRSADAFSGVSIAAFGVVNAVAILGSAAFLATALEVALSPVGVAATAAELWMIGYLLFRGVSRQTLDQAPRDTAGGRAIVLKKLTGLSDDNGPANLAPRGDCLGAHECLVALDDTNPTQGRATDDRDNDGLDACTGCRDRGRGGDRWHRSVPTRHRVGGAARASVEPRGAHCPADRPGRSSAKAGTFDSGDPGGR